MCSPQLLDAGGPKGDAFVTARLAGIGAAKHTATLIPLCHPLPLDKVDVELTADRDAGTVAIRAEARVTARTGVEMEALVAASVAALTLVDMAKALQRDIVIERVELLEKSGGRSGDYRSDAWRRRTGRDPRGGRRDLLESIRGGGAGGHVGTGASSLHCATPASTWHPRPSSSPTTRAQIAALLVRLADAGHRLILTTGGTGLTPTDVTPAATRRCIDREAPGLAELMRTAGLASTPMAALSRGVVGARGAVPDRESAGVAEGRDRVPRRAPAGAPPRDRAARRRRPLASGTVAALR